VFFVQASPNDQCSTGQSRPIRLDLPWGTVNVRLVRVDEKEMLVVTSITLPEVPVVRFQSACVFGEGFRAVDCDCGVQLEAALELICRDGGVLTYGWEEGRGLGIAAKLEAIAIQQEKGVDTAEAFRLLGHSPEPRSFDNHVQALRTVFEGDAIKLVSRNAAKIGALSRAGISVVDRIVLEIPSTPEREAYLKQKTSALGHLP
jgi:GTP cyclohydrolase II